MPLPVSDISISEQIIVQNLTTAEMVNKTGKHCYKDLMTQLMTI